MKQFYGRIGLFLFSSSIILNSLPSYYEGIQEIRNKPVERIDHKGMCRKMGFYFLMSGFFLIFCVGRGRIPFLNTKL
jgi:hypothetical protein